MSDRSSSRQLTAAEYDALPWLHIHAQPFEHAEAMIIGTREALVALRDAIDAALADKNGQAKAEMMAADGEGYGVQFRRVPRSALQHNRLPYTDRIRRPAYR